MAPSDGAGHVVNRMPTVLLFGGFVRKLCENSDGEKFGRTTFYRTALHKMLIF
jgi:hypothetical protein